MSGAGSKRADGRRAASEAFRHVLERIVDGLVAADLALGQLDLLGLAASLYGTCSSRWLMTFRRTRFLSSERATYHGAQDGVGGGEHLVARLRCSRPSGRRTSGPSARASRSCGRRRCAPRSRRVCSSGLTSSQYFSRMMPDSTISRLEQRHALQEAASPAPRCRSPSRARRRRGCTSCGRRSRPRRRPAGAAGSAGTYICDFSRSVGAGSATTRNTRGLTRSVMALMVPPLPAPSRPSKTMQTFRPLCTTHCCSFTSSTCSFFSSRA